MHTMGYYSATKRNKLLVHVNVLMDLKIIMPRKIGETKKENACSVISFTQKFKSGFSSRNIYVVTLR